MKLEQMLLCLLRKNGLKKTKAIGIVSKSGRYGGGTFAHKDIVFEFATWISPEFKLYLIKEFQRLKIEENEKLTLGWDAKRMLTKINYKIHTDAIRENIILPQKLSKEVANITYASEADVLREYEILNWSNSTGFIPPTPTFFQSWLPYGRLFGDRRFVDDSRWGSA